MLGDHRWVCRHLAVPDDPVGDDFEFPVDVLLIEELFEILLMVDFVSTSKGGEQSTVLSRHPLVESGSFLVEFAIVSAQQQVVQLACECVLCVA